MNLDLLSQTAANCTQCELYKGRLNPVFAKGNPNAKVMICGMVPAKEENKAGLPFVGRAGKLLDTILHDVGWSLDDVYITNLVKCYLAAGLPLKQHWIDSCLSYLIIQIELIKPRVIITLGKDASVSLLGLDSKIAMGKIRKQEVFDYDKDIKLVPTYHPSYLLRGGGIEHRNYMDVIEDFLRAMTFSLDN